MSNKKILTHKLAAENLKIGQSTLYRLVREGKVRALKPGGKLMYRQEFLTAYTLGFGTRLTASQRAQIALLDSPSSEDE